jgi:hypothetical protein
MLNGLHPFLTYLLTLLVMTSSQQSGKQRDIPVEFSSVFLLKEEREREVGMNSSRRGGEKRKSWNNC